LAKEAQASESDTEPYDPRETRMRRPNAPSRMFNVRLTDQQYADPQQIAQRKHLPMSTMARSWLLDRLDTERRTG